MMYSVNLWRNEKVFEWPKAHPDIAVYEVVPYSVDEIEGQPNLDRAAHDCKWYPFDEAFGEKFFNDVKSLGGK